MNMHATLSAAPSTGLASKAMLAGVNIKQWSGRKLDKAVTDQVNRDHGASADAGRFNKSLVSRDALAAIVAVSNRARKEHYSRTLPWHDDGARILSAAGYLEFSRVMHDLRTEFDGAVADFVAGYVDFREAAKVRLNGMFKEADYPPADDIGRRFAFGVSIDPMPNAADFRVDVSQVEADRIRADIQARSDAAIKAAMGDVFSRVCEAVGHMAEKLTATRDGGKADIFRDSLVENVRDLVRLLPSLNITGDAKLTEVAARMDADLCRYDADALRDDPGARRDTAMAAAAILSDVNDYLA